MSKKRAHYTFYVANQICEKIALGMSLKKTLEEIPLAPLMPLFWRWLDEYPEFRERYERARQMAADIHADTMLDMAHDAVANPSKASAIRVATDILKWQAEIRDPKKYGPKAQVKEKDKAMSPDELRKEIAKLEHELGVKAVPGMNTAPNFVRKDQPSAEPAPAPNPPSDSHSAAHCDFEAPERLQ